MQSVPPHLNVFSLIMLLGVAQGLFLGLFFLAGPARNWPGQPTVAGYVVANRCLGWFMLALSAISAEILLNYTNYTFRLLWTVDVTEPINLAVGPLLYYAVASRVRGRLPPGWAWHLLPFLIWLLNAVTWIDQPAEFRYNAYIDSWHPELRPVPVRERWPEDITGLRPYISELTALSCLVYAGLSLLTLRRAIGQQPAPATGSALRPLWLLSGLFALLPGLIVPVRLYFYRDLGDHLLASYATLTLYATSFLLMRDAAFFQQPPPPTGPVDEPSALKRKYEKSALSDEVETALLQKLTRLLTDEKPYLRSDLSLPKLASQLGTTPHYLSQLLNDRLQKSFFDLLADYRVQEAQTLLASPATTHLKIDEIAERVGYNSTSAFHTAFKRLTGQTPAQYRQATASR